MEKNKIGLKKYVWTGGRKMGVQWPKKSEWKMVEKMGESRDKIN